MPELSDIETKLSDKQEEINKNGQALIDEYNKNQRSLKITRLPPSITTGSVETTDTASEAVPSVPTKQPAGACQVATGVAEPVNRKIQEAIQAVGAENNFTYILDAAAIMYVNPSAENITQLVKTRLGI